jgi:hypothetical protein
VKCAHTHTHTHTHARTHTHTRTADETSLTIITTPMEKLRSNAVFDLFSGGSSSSAIYCDRTATWTHILKKLAKATNNNSSHASTRASGDFEKLAEFAAGNNRWVDKVPSEWREIYGAIYEESRNFEIAENQIVSISKDVHRTFGLFQRTLPHLRHRIESKQEEYYSSLTSILTAHSHERNYCQGVNFLAAAFLLSEENERDAFTVLCFILKQRHLEVLFNPKCSSLMEYMKLFEKKLRKHNKAIYDHFRSVGYGTFCYAIEWFTTCFIVSNPGLISSCAIDLIIAGFDDIMIRIGLSILNTLQPKILSSSVEVLQEGFKFMQASVDPVTVILGALTLQHLDMRGNSLQRMHLNMDFMAPNTELVNTLRAHISVTDPDHDEDTITALDLLPRQSPGFADSRNGPKGSPSSMTIESPHPRQPQRQSPPQQLPAPISDADDSVSWHSEEVSSYVFIDASSGKRKQKSKKSGTGNHDASKSFHRRQILKDIRQKRRKLAKPKWTYGVFLLATETGDMVTTFRPLLGPLPYTIPARSVHDMLESEEENYSINTTSVKGPTIFNTNSRTQSPLGGNEEIISIQSAGSSKAGSTSNQNNVLFPLVWKLLNVGQQDQQKQVAVDFRSGQVLDTTVAEGLMQPLMSPGEQFLGDIESLSSGSNDMDCGNEAMPLVSSLSDEDSINNESKNETTTAKTDKRSAAYEEFPIPEYKSNWRRQRRMARQLNLSEYFIEDNSPQPSSTAGADKLASKKSNTGQSSAAPNGTFPVQVHDALDSLEWCDRQVRRVRLRKLIRKIQSRSEYQFISMFSDRTWNDMCLSSYSSDDCQPNGDRRQRSPLLARKKNKSKYDEVYHSLESMTNPGHETKSKSAGGKQRANANSNEGASAAASESLAQTIRRTPSTGHGDAKGKRPLVVAIKALKSLGLRSDSLGKASKDVVQQAIKDADKQKAGKKQPTTTGSGGAKTSDNRTDMGPNLEAGSNPAAASGSAESNPSDWLTNAVHTTLWLGSFGMVSRSVPGKSLALRDDQLSDTEVRGKAKSGKR